MSATGSSIVFCSKSRIVSWAKGHTACEETVFGEDSDGVDEEDGNCEDSLASDFQGFSVR